MTEADRVFSAHGVASIDVVKGQIEKALANGDEAEALRLDSLLQEIEGMVENCKGNCPENSADLGTSGEPER